MKLFVANPSRLIILRGNHEEKSTWADYSFGKIEIFTKFPSKNGYNPLLYDENRVKKMFTVFCERLPHAVYISYSDETQDPHYFVQCCHGGIEPRFDPQPLLQDTSGKEFLHASKDCTYGLNWSDFTGVDHDRTDTEEWVRNTRGGDSGFLADIPDTKKYFEMMGLKAIFRGHQDEHTSFKLVVKDHPWVVPWQNLLASEGQTEETLRDSGIKLGRFVGVDETVPVFTLSTAAEARGLPDEGFAVLVVSSPCFEDWLLHPFVYPIPRDEFDLAGSFVHCRKDDNKKYAFTYSKEVL